MRIKKMKAIDILDKLNLKLLTIDGKLYTSWQAQTKSYVMLLFGENSPEYTFINEFSFSGFGHGDADWLVDQAKPSLFQFIENCKETIVHKGVKKKEWKHIFITTNPAIFWSVFVTSLGLAFWLGVEFTQNKSNKTAEQNTANKYDSTHKK